MAGSSDRLDVLRLPERRTRLVVHFGSVNVTFALDGGTLNESLNEQPTADLSLRYALTAGQPVDYFAPVAVALQRGGEARVRFTGLVTEAAPEGDKVAVSAVSAPELSERQVGVFEGRNSIAPEIIHLMARSAGLPEDRVNVEGLDGYFPLEAVEVLVPLRGVTVTKPFTFGDVTIVPAERGHDGLAEFGDSESTRELRRADSYAVVTRVTRRMLDAEVYALGQVDAMLAWLVVRSRYGLALMPDGEPQPFRRETARARPNRERLVLVRGLASGRQWLRSPEGFEAASELPLDPHDSSWDLPRRVTVQDRQALLACARAARGGDTLERIQALWEAIEFYVSGVAAPQLFDPEEVKRVRRAVPKDIDRLLRERALDLLGKVTDPPLMARLSEALRRDGVPIAPGELSLLRDLRTARNDAVHGRSPDLPQLEDVDHAVSVVARMILYRLSRRRPDRRR